MDPYTPITQFQSVFTSQAFGNNVFLASAFTTVDERDSFLASLDSDTRDYVLKHTPEFRTKNDILECVAKLHGRY